MLSSRSCLRDMHKWEGGQKVKRAEKSVLSSCPAKWFLHLAKAKPQELRESSLKRPRRSARRDLKGCYFYFSFFFWGQYQV
jgi:hypothetical protein